MALRATADRQGQPSAWDGSFSIREGVVSAVVVLVLPVAMYIAGVASLGRLIFPASAFMLAGYFHAKRSPWYIGHCIWLFCFTPLVRRLVDEQAGWDPSNPVLLAPYLACAFAGVSFVQYVFEKRKPFLATYAILILCTGYGFLLAVLNGRLLSGAVDAMRWSAGPLIAAHLLSRSDRWAAMHKVAVIVLVIAGPIMGAYAIWQYLSPQPWDADWMINVASLGLNSIGVPRPFELRVFGTMNSPGSLGTVLMAAILVTFQRPLLLALPSLLPMIIGLLLTQYRAIWAGTLLGIVCLTLRGPPRVKLGVVVTGALLVLMLSSAAVVPQFHDAITQRLQSINTLSSDASGEDRLHQYEEFLTNDDQSLILGQGIAIEGASRRLDHNNTVVIDSGFISLYTALGVFVGTLFIVGLAASIALTFFPAPMHRAEMQLYRAMALSLFCQLPFGGVYASELGFFAWVFIGLASSLLRALEVPEPMVLVPSYRVQR